MKNNKQNLTLVIITIITIIIWIGTNLYHISVTSTIPEDVRQTVSPFDPRIDTAVFETLKKKKNVDELSVSLNQTTQSAIINQATTSGQSR